MFGMVGTIPLEPEDYRKLFGILDAVSTADGADFFRALTEALHRHLGWVDVVVAPEEFPPVMLDQRLTRKLGGVIDAGESGRALVCLYATDENTIGERERDLMAYLSRHLRPWLREYFAAVRGNRDRGLLTDREEDVARLIAQGLSNLQIAQRLCINVDTVKKHLLRAMEKAQCANRTQLALFMLGHPFAEVA